MRLIQKFRRDEPRVPIYVKDHAEQAAVNEREYGRLFFCPWNFFFFVRRVFANTAIAVIILERKSGQPLRADGNARRGTRHCQRPYF